MPDAVDMCPHCGYLLTHGEKARRILSAKTYLGAVIFLVIIGLFAAAYLTAEQVEAADLIPDSADLVGSVSLDALPGTFAEGALFFLEEGEFDHYGTIMEYCSAVHLATEESCGSEGDCTIIILKVDDRQSFTDMITEQYPGESVREYRGVAVYDIHEPHAYYWAGDYCVFGNDALIDRSIDAYKGATGAMADDTKYAAMGSELSHYAVWAYAPGLSGDIDDVDDALGLAEDFAGFDALGLGMDPRTGDIALLLDFTSSQDAMSIALMLNLIIAQDESGDMEEYGLTMDIDGTLMRITLVLPEDIGIDDLVQLEEYSGSLI